MCLQQAKKNIYQGLEKKKQWEPKGSDSSGMIIEHNSDIMEACVTFRRDLHWTP